ncbi:MAG TPA: heme lyase CcmF/NrfE family subunit [Myxococcaceae bacterium]|nr:heme lyase CcmF/NrfE family subunit [Myxococcaceae bacterium]
MNSTLGSTLILIALALAAFGGVAGLISGLTGREQGYKLVRWATWGFAAAMILANLVMEGALLTHDYSVKYVAQVGSNTTPTVYTVVSLWSALEGSILFWGAILGVYLAAFAWVNRERDRKFVTLCLSVMLLVGCFFGFLIAGPANPFLPTPAPIPTDGPGPNPLLQNHLLMVIHPPMLYLGYVGMTVPFGIAVAGLIAGRLGESWMQPLRRWTLVPWVFLSTGIVLGAWWAYAVLGWGGYWAWDPVENASFLPWLTATAFMHSTMVQERRRMLRIWTVSLVMTTFWLTILGTFMTRSGIFNSVHSFTQSDIGPTFLVFLGLLTVVTVVLLTWRGPMLAAEDSIKSPWSRETAILFTNVLLVAFTFVVFLGTTIPLVVEALENRRISVGEPYFNKFAIPLALLILFNMGVGPSLPWGSTTPVRALKRLVAPAVAGVVVAGACLAFGLRGWQAILAFALAGFVVVVTLREMFLPVWQRVRERKEPLLESLVESVVRARRRFGGYVVHLGVVIVCVGVAASSSYTVAASGTVSQGQTVTVGDYQLRFAGIEQGQEPHRAWVAAVFQITQGSGVGEQLAPRQNFYPRNTDPVGTPAVRSNLKEDLYFTLMSYDAQRRTATFRAWVFPMVGWIWSALPFFATGVAIAVWPARRRVPLKVEAGASVAAAAPPAGGAA